MIQAKYSNKREVLTKTQENKSSQKEFWINEFAEEFKILELPADFARPPIKGYESNSVKFELSEEETKSLKSLASEAGSSMFMVLLAVYNILVSKLSNQEDIVVGTPISGYQYADLKIMIGMVENTIPIRNYPKGELSFSDFLSVLTTRTLACFDNQAFRYEDLVYELNIDLDPSRNPLIDVMFSYLKFEKPELKIPGLTLHLCDEGHGITQYDLTLLARETDEKLYLIYEYSSELFKEETIERFVSYFKEIISTVISKPNTKISKIEIITNKEKDLILPDLVRRQDTDKHERQENIQ